MVLDAHVLLCVVAGFLEKKIFAKNSFFSLYFFLNLVHKESLYQLLYFCTNPILGENLVPEIWAKIILSNQIAGFLDIQYL